MPNYGKQQFLSEVLYVEVYKLIYISQLSKCCKDNIYSSWIDLEARQLTRHY